MPYDPKHGRPSEDGAVIATPKHTVESLTEPGSDYRITPGLLRWLREVFDKQADFAARAVPNGDQTHFTHDYRMGVLAGVRHVLTLAEKKAEGQDDG